MTKLLLIPYSSNERPVANQTEIIYTVLVNGRAVLATTAAKDMELVSEVEAVNTLGKPIYMKSERKCDYTLLKSTI